MRRISALVVVLGLAVMAAGSALATQRPMIRSLRVSSAAKVTGTIRALGSAEITVGRTTCSMRSSKVAELAGGFAVGENVTIDCVNSSLHSIILAPETSGPTHPDWIVASVKGAGLASQPSGGGGAGGGSSCGAGGDNTITWTSGTTGSRSVAGTICASGTVTAVSPGGITVGDQTCPFLLSSSNPLDPSPGFLRNVQVGQQAVMSCTTFSNGQSNGSISLSP